MQIVIVEQLELRCLDAGKLQPWLGPAVRGAVAKPWKSAVCRLSLAEQDRNKNCWFGCPHHRTCDYGKVVEPHAAGQPQTAGSTHIVFAPQYPSVAGGHAQPGTVVPLRLVLIGPAIESRETILDTLSVSLRQHGFGEANSVKCELIRDAEQLTTHDLLPGHLPTAPNDQRTTVPRVRIRLSSPLILKQKHQRGGPVANGQRCLNLRPHLADLLSPSLNLINRLLGQLSETPCFDRVTTSSLKGAADGHPPIEENFKLCDQGKFSSRQEEGYLARGIVGEAVYADVPSGLIPWLEWGGRLHVGDHRVAGAGGWDVTLE